MYTCEVCCQEHETRKTLQFLYVQSTPLDPEVIARIAGKEVTEADTAPRQFSWVVCQAICADKVRNSPDTAKVLVDETFAG